MLNKLVNISLSSCQTLSDSISAICSYDKTAAQAAGFDATALNTVYEAITVICTTLNKASANLSSVNNESALTNDGLVTGGNQGIGPLHISANGKNTVSENIITESDTSSNPVTPNGLSTADNFKTSVFNEEDFVIEQVFKTNTVQIPATYTEQISATGAPGKNICKTNTKKQIVKNSDSKYIAMLLDGKVTIVDKSTSKPISVDFGNSFIEAGVNIC